MKTWTLLITISCCLPVQAGDDRNEVAQHQWPQWRGPLATGVAPHAVPPIEWSEQKNIRWKTPLPGKGHSAPIVWGERVFLTAAIPFGDALPTKHADVHGAHNNLPVSRQHKFVILAVDRKAGRIVWQKVVREALPHAGGHATGSLASNSPVTDGEFVFASFGSNGLYCLDVNGELKWQVDLGKMRSKHAHGEGGSPVLYGDALFVNWDHEGQSFLFAFDKHTGEQRWKVARDEATSWATPIVVEHEGKTQIIVSGTNRVRGYDLATGQVIWECGGLSANIVASPVAADGMVFAGSSYEKRAMLAIRLSGAAGDITGSEQVVWSRNQGTPYVPSPLLYGDSLYFLRHYQAILTRVSAKTGTDQYGPFRLSGLRNVYASPVGAAGRIYVTDLDGRTLVFIHEKEPTMLALNQLDDSFSASAALVGRELFLRGERNLYCIADEENE